MDAKEEGIKKLIATIRDGLVAEFQHGFIFKGKQVIPEDESKDIAGLLAERTADVIRKAILGDQRIYFAPAREITKPADGKALI